MMKLLISHIEELAEKGKYSKDTRVILDILLSAINDWPNAIDNLDDYVIAVQDFIPNTATKRNIERVLNNIDFTKYAWQSESLSQLLEVYVFFPEESSLQEIINELKEQSSI